MQLHLLSNKKLFIRLIAPFEVAIGEGAKPSSIFSEPFSRASELEAF